MTAFEKTAEVFNIAEALNVGKSVDQEAIKEACSFLVHAIDQGEITHILSALKHHDDYTYAHSIKVSVLLMLFGKGLGMTPKEQLILGTGGYLHDVGKQRIPQDILNKPGKPKPDEWIVMQSHVPKSIELISQIRNVPKASIIIAAQHHENLNGSGYPKGLR